MPHQEYWACMSRTLTVTSIALLAVLAIVSVAFLVGRFPIAPGEIATIVWAKLSGGSHALPATMETVIFRIRGPRVLAGAISSPSPTTRPTRTSHQWPVAPYADRPRKLASAS